VGANKEYVMKIQSDDLPIQLGQIAIDFEQINHNLVEDARPYQSSRLCSQALVYPQENV